MDIVIEIHNENLKRSNYLHKLFVLYFVIHGTLEYYVNYGLEIASEV